MVKSKFYFFKVQVKVLFRYSSIMIQPGLCITPESFNTIDMTSIFKYIFFHSVSNYLMFSD